ncbi:MAG: ion transporter [Polaribacter sp.]|nr:ion transporter [Polaribacter sp.]
MIKKIAISRIFEKFIFLLIVFNLIAMVAESEQNLSTEIKSYLEMFEVFSIIIFTLEYLFRSVVSFKKKDSYNLSFFGVIDLLAILPFYLQSILGFDGRFIRIFRLFRISRVLKLGRFSKSFELLSKGVSNVKLELSLTFSIAFIMLFFSASGIYFLENPVQPDTFHSIRASFWWAVASLTGVGFEEIFPITVGGKIFGSLISLIGIGVVAVPTGIISASFVEVINTHKENKNGK